MTTQADTREAVSPLFVFDDGPWTYDPTGQKFHGEEMDEYAFIVYRQQLTELRAECWRLREERDSFQRVGIAAEARADEAERLLHIARPMLVQASEDRYGEFSDTEASDAIDAHIAAIDAALKDHP